MKCWCLAFVVLLIRQLCVKKVEVESGVDIHGTFKSYSGTPYNSCYVRYPLDSYS